MGASQVMEVFQEMVYKGCERSVITYSSLISACEKARAQPILAAYCLTPTMAAFTHSC
jgi:hypothetical protein